MDDSRHNAISPAARREARFTALVWVVSCTWTVGYAALFAYRRDPAPAFILGMPGWVFWGVVLPWTACTAVTAWYAFYGMVDEDLGEDRQRAIGEPESGPAHE